MRAIVGAAAVPAAPLLLPEVSPDQPAAIRDEVAALRSDARRALEGLSGVDVVVLVAPGSRGIHDRALATLKPLGVDIPDVELPVADVIIEHLSRLTQYPMFRGDPLNLDHSVLLLQVRAVLGDVAVLPICVPAATEFDVLVSVGASIVESVRDARLRAAAVVSGDLSAALTEASPAYLIEGAQAWDRSVLHAVNDGGLRALRDLGPDEADRVSARGWAPLVALHGICAAGRLQPSLIGYHAPRGVGEVVLRCEPVGDTSDRYERAPGAEHEGVVRRTGDRRG